MCAVYASTSIGQATVEKTLTRHTDRSRHIPGRHRGPEGVEDSAASSHGSIQRKAYMVNMVQIDSHCDHRHRNRHHHDHDHHHHDHDEHHREIVS